MFVLTLLSTAVITEAVQTKLKDLLKQFDVKVVASKALNSENSALDWTIDRSPAGLKDALYKFSDQQKLDIILQEDKPSRQKKLVVFDMDSTLIQQEVIDMIAAYAGVEKEVSAVTEAAMRGEIDFSESLAQRVALLKGVPVGVYEDMKKKITLSPGAEQLCKTLKANGVKMAVLSGGFIPLASWIKGKLGLDYAFANTLEDDGTALTGKTQGRIVNNTAKAELLEEIAEKEGIPLESVVAVGDGSNDLDMMAKAGFGIAFSAKPLVQKRAPSRFNTGNLADILYILGYEQ